MHDVNVKIFQVLQDNVELIKLEYIAWNYSSSDRVWNDWISNTPNALQDVAFGAQDVAFHQLMREASNREQLFLVKGEIRLPVSQPQYTEQKPQKGHKFRMKRLG